FQTEAGLQEISTLSPLVQTLIRPKQQTWLLYLQQVEGWLQQIMMNWTLGD
ncbi:MAG: hypothetical protein F6K19_49785, partial [Cyanothece sp. SIO1E1]|nr:hypothetical protein [Cyanothece sp. SIO1E1]